MKASRPDPLTESRTTVLATGGRTCGACVQHVLSKLDDVQTAQVDLARQQARVVYESELVDDQDLMAA
tara:strand:+ start:6195 stop:6398 length:204 start_codon:yes stop_codon:yes gene_type:complete